MPVAGPSKRGPLGAIKDQLLGTKEQRKAEKQKKKEQVISFALRQLGPVLTHFTGACSQGSAATIYLPDGYGPPAALR
jgi:hypothetical protein